MSAVMIAEVAHVRRRHPRAPEDAVEHLMWALHRARPLVEAGEPDAGEALRYDLAAYPGSLADFDGLGVPEIFAALADSRYAVAETLALLGLLQPAVRR